jgi:predicted dinucleotide-binding enzyme
MKIGILGAGFIGKTLAIKLSAAGHDVKVANSRGPATIEAETLSTGAKAVSADDAVKDVDVLILSIPLNRTPDVVQLVAQTPGDAVVIDTSNYYPQRDGIIAAIEAGQPESEWVAEQLGRRIVKAWNSIVADSFEKKGLPAGSPGRIALSVAADVEAHRKVGMQLVEETGFDAVDGGTLAESWRQQPGAPAYCTDLSRDELPKALAAADKARSPERRDLAIAAVMERYEGLKEMPDGDWLVQLNRASYM